MAEETYVPADARESIAGYDGWGADCGVPPCCCNLSGRPATIDRRGVDRQFRLRSSSRSTWVHAAFILFRIRQNRYTATVEDEPLGGARIGSDEQSILVKVESPWNIAVAVRRNMHRSALTFRYPHLYSNDLRVLPFRSVANCGSGGLTLRVKRTARSHLSGFPMRHPRRHPSRHLPGSGRRPRSFWRRPHLRAGAEPGHLPS